jgi:hypothetical protein
LLRWLTTWEMYGAARAGPNSNPVDTRDPRWDAFELAAEVPRCSVPQAGAPALED